MFVQIIEGRTSDAEGLARQGERWSVDLAPAAIGFLGATMGTTADGHAINVARFDSAESARANSDRPEQGTWWAETEKFYDGEVTFTESTDVEEFRGGGSNDAGFVQVMKSTGADRAELARLDEQFARHPEARPDLLGMLRIWTGDRDCVEVAYFTSETEARVGEQSELPGELRDLMVGLEQAMGTTEFLDLEAPTLV